MANYDSLESAREFFYQDKFAVDTGITLDELTEDKAICSLELTDNHKNAYGGVMGGVTDLLKYIIKPTGAFSMCDARQSSVMTAAPKPAISLSMNARIFSGVGSLMLRTAASTVSASMMMALSMVLGRLPS